MQILKYTTFGMALLLALGITGCARKAIPSAFRTLKENIIVSRKGNSYKIEFNEEKNWTLFSGTSASTINWEKPAHQFNGDSYTFKYDKKKPRLFFGIINPDKTTTVATERQIMLTKTPNFRDLGGMTTQDGRMVSWGKIYRSGSLHALKDKDFIKLQSMGILTVCDLRNDLETTKKPDTLPDGIKYEQHAIGGKEGAAFAELVNKVRKEKYRRTQIRDLFTNLMVSFTDSAASDFKPIIDNLLNGDTDPLIFHCAGGKDRTGFLAAIILLALNVDRETIKQDYMMSNYYREYRNRKRARLAKLLFLDNETLSYGLLVHEEYIDAVFDVIDKKYGGRDNYLEKEFGLDKAKRQKLIDFFTVTPNEF